ncbi:MAG: ABC transporter permease, partial [Planctomycetota bacterium]
GLFPPIRRSYRDQNPDIRLKAPWKSVERRAFVIPFQGETDADIPGGREPLSMIEGGYLLGTDTQGRDVLSRLLYGTRISLTIGVFAVAIYVTIGIFFGALAGFFGGWVDILIMRFIEIMMCFPSFFLILTIISILEHRSIYYIMLIIGVTRWTGPARLVRGEFLKQKTIDYVIAAKALGVGRMKIMFKHILPNAMAPVLVAATFGIAAAILVEASLSFLGLGDDRAPSWGQMLTAGRVSQEYYLILLSGFAIFFTVTVLNLVGEGVRDALDPKLRQ